MRLNLHDFSGHPFQVQLSRELARRGHEVLHEYCPEYITGHGRLRVERDDPATLRIEAVSCEMPMAKYAPVWRTRWELAYAQVWQERLAARQFDLVVACNVPLIAMARMRRYFARRNQPWVFWHQDIYSAGMAAEAHSRLPRPLAQSAAATFDRMERSLVRDAAGVVAISDEFVHQYRRWDLSDAEVRVIPNWAPLDEILPGERDNAWARRQQIPSDVVRLLYAGTLGRKHNPLLLLTLLDAARARGVDAHLTVVSEGVGAQDLAVAARGRRDVRILGYQPAEDLSDVLASADVVLAVLEPDAAKFSVPSKVLSYLAAGRPTIALVPDGNPCTADVESAGGCVAPPTDAGAMAAATWLHDVTGAQGLRRLGERARAVAEQRFAIDGIADQFESAFAAAANVSDMAMV